VGGVDSIRLVMSVGPAASGFVELERDRQRGVHVAALYANGSVHVSMLVIGLICVTWCCRFMHASFHVSTLRFVAVEAGGSF
jgi:hypothetical protein